MDSSYSLPILVMMALGGGFSLGLNRVFLGRLSGAGAAQASFINHAGGAIFVFLAAYWSGQLMSLSRFLEVPPSIYMGGVIGAIFVAISSWLVPRLGVMKTTVLVISGQMFSSTLIDFFSNKIASLGQAALGLGLIVAGVWVGARGR